MKFAFSWLIWFSAVIFDAKGDGHSRHIVWLSSQMQPMVSNLMLICIWPPSCPSFPYTHCHSIYGFWCWKFRLRLIMLENWSVGTLWKVLISSFWAASFLHLDWQASLIRPVPDYIGSFSCELTCILIHIDAGN
jgi:hypothetical protein